MKNNKQKTEIPKKKTNTIISFLIFFIVVQSFFAYENIINKLSQKFNNAISCFKSNDQLNETNKTKNWSEVKKLSKKNNQITENRLTVFFSDLPNLEVK
jgi:hypothetical protein